MEGRLLSPGLILFLTYMFYAGSNKHCAKDMRTELAFWEVMSLQISMGFGEIH
jgi:hypothetical protein